MSANPKRTQTSRDLRRRMNGAEWKLWKALRNLDAGDLRFRRQHPIGPFFVDFYCAKAGLALELDGTSHDGKDQYDLRRDEFILGHGVKVIRLKNEVTDDLNVDYAAEWFLEECRSEIERKRGEQPEK
jgi:ATP-dependent DNA helicase RecQ